MRTLIAYAVAAAILASTAGCLFRARPAEYRSCGPGYHWDDGECRHNGNRDHDRDHDHDHDHDRDHRDHDDHGHDHDGDRDHRD